MGDEIHGHGLCGGGQRPGTSREGVVSEAFRTLLKDWGKTRDLIFIPQYEYQTLQKTRVYPDGALLHSLRVPLGYWEAKDEEDDLVAEIEKKFRKGYPQDNRRRPVAAQRIGEECHFRTLASIRTRFSRASILRFDQLAACARPGA